MTQNQTAHLRAERLHEMVSEQVARTPDAVAIEFEGEQLSFAALERRANRLAQTLVGRGVGADVRVGICADRSLDMVIGLLGVLKAGGAYVPLDPAHPRARLAFVLAEIQAPVVLAQRHLKDVLPEHHGETVLLDEPEAFEGASGEPPETCVTPDHLAYVIHTSGSTGRPKGAMNTHRAICSHLWWMQEAYALTPDDRVLHKTPFSFDVSVWEIFWPLSMGARLIIARPGGHREPTYLARTIAEHRVTTLHFVPSMLRVFLEARNLDSVECVKRVICSGETLSPDLCDTFFRRIDAELHNLYGPTEAAIDVTAYRCDARRRDASVPIGRPVANTTIHILDAQLQPVPVGVAGELFIGGIQLARGYLGRPRLTAERFVADPFGPPGGRLYRTGDIGRVQPDGNIEFLGRNDDQIKIRGIRVELGEIEASLVAQPDVRAAAVVLHERDGGDQRLIGYVTAAPEATPEPAALRRELERRLPTHMVPSAIVVVDAFPLTPNGKLDRRRLTEIALPERQTGESLAPPRNEIESIIAEVFADVLDVARVGIHDHFADLGGHSLLATRLIARIRDRCGVELLVGTIFAHPTVEALAAIVELAQKTHDQPHTGRIQPVSRESGDLPLSFGQQRLWFLDQVGAGKAYNLFRGWRLCGELDRPAMAAALGDLVERHESLRTRFPLVDGQPVQVVDPAEPIELRHVDLRARPEPEARAEADQHVARELGTPFDLARGPIFRATLVSVSADEHWLLLSTHHIVSDGWSLDVLRRDLAALYTARVTSVAATLPALPIQCADHAVWDRGRMQGAAFDRSLAYWRAKLADLPALDVPTDFPRDSAPTRDGRGVEFVVPATVVTRLHAVARRAGVTTAMVMQAALTAVLHRHTSQEEIVIGTAVANRNRAELENLIGFFVDSVVMRTDHGGDPTFAELLARTRDVALEAYDHQDVPFERLVDEVSPHRDLGRNPLFQVFFTMMGAPPPTMTPDDLPLGLVLEPIDTESTTARFDLALYMLESPDDLTGNVVYDTTLFRPTTVERMTRHLLNVLEAATADPTTRLSELPLLLDADRRHTLATWNDEDLRSEAKEPAGGFDLLGLLDTVCDRFEDETALLVGSRTISYGELDQASRRIAAALQAGALPVGGTVAVGLRDRAQLIAAMLGIWRAGGVFVPLDPDGPEVRARGMLERVRAAYVLAETHDVTRLNGILPRSTIAFAPPDETGWCRGMLQPAGRALDAFETDPPPVTHDPDATAYIYHTSGSTGRPKGIAGTLRGLAQFVQWEIAAFEVGPGARVSQLIVPTFDPFFRDVLVPLCVGGTACVPTADVRLDPPALLAWIDEQRIQLVHSSPSFFSLLADAAHDPERLRSLEHVVLAGEVLPVDLVRRWKRVFGERITLVNVYGPSESTMAKLFHVVEPADVTRRSIPIGKPIPGSRVALADGSGHLAAPGTVGELLIRSPYLTRGYVDDPEQTRARFVPNPLGGDVDEIVYRTGDLARQLDDGSFEFVGRVDHQVKIRGIRVEPGEIESVLRADPTVREAVVVCREDDPGTKRLIAYVVGQRGSDLERARLRARLERALPEAMVPSAFVGLNELPLNANGKIDRRALPAPDFASIATETAFQPPRTESEKILAGIWSEILRVDAVGTNDNFFELGGDSILSIKIVTRANKAGLQLRPRDIFDRQTIGELAAAAGAAPPPAPPAPPAPRPQNGAAPDDAAIPAPPRARVERNRSPDVEDIYPLSPMQQGMAYHSARDDGTGAYVQQRHLTLDGLDAIAFRAAWDRVIARHAILRTSIVDADFGNPRQVVRRSIDLPWVEHDGRSLDEPERHAWLARSHERDRTRGFDLAEAPLMRMTLLRVGERRWEFIWTHHHLLLDGWSVPLLWDELFTIYDALRQGTEPVLPAPVPYRTYIEWLERQDSDEVDAYWRDALAGFAEPTRLGIDRAPGHRAANVRDDGMITCELPEALSASLREVAARQRVTLNALLMSVWSILLSRYSGQTDVLFGTVVSDRRPDIDGGESMVGLLINTQPTRVHVEPDTAFGTWLQTVQETLVQQREHAHGALWRAQKQSDVPADTPLFESLFVFENYPRQRGAPSDGELEIRRHPSTHRTGYPLTMVVNPTTGLVTQLLFDGSRFARTSIDRMGRHYVNLLRAVTQRPETCIGDLPMLDPAERRRLTTGSNDTTRPYPRDASVPALFRAQAARTPAAVAVTYGADAITYAALDDRTDRLATHLRTQGIVRGDLVAICVERGIDLIVAMLGVLKAGAAYVPLDPAHPAARLALMLEDTNARALLTHSTARDGLPDVTCPVVRLDRDWPVIAATPVSTPPVEIDAGDLAYVIYTSGSTGRPKGVCVPHRAIARLVLGTDYAQLGPDDRIAQAANASFDAATFEIWGGLLTGARVVGLDTDTTLAPERFADAIRERGITVLFITTALFNQLGAEVPDIFAPLGCLLFGGEAVDPQRVRAVLQNGAPARLLHVYGPTENTTFSTWHEVTDVPPDARTVPIGRPIANSTMLVLDGTGRPVPAGAPGELYVGGDGLAVAYLDDPELTASRFVPHPFARGERLYRTGDLVRLRDDGAIEFIGRVDHQVKLRGFRIEPGEIEAVLLREPAVRDATVLCREDVPGDKRLVAYVVAAEGQTIDRDDLREHVRDALPEFMVPSAIVELEAMPLSVNGKVDRRALPAPTAGADGPRERCAPRTAAERILAGIWGNVLHQDDVSIHDDFFYDLGGHSLLAMRVMSQVRRRFGIDLPLRSLFDEPTIAGFCQTIELLRASPEHRQSADPRHEELWI